MVQADHAPSGAFLQRFGDVNRRLRALEAFMGSINSSSAHSGVNVLTASTSYVASSPANSTTATCGLAGDFCVIASATMTIDPGASAEVGLYESGALLIDPFLILSNNTSGQITVSCSQVNILSGFTPYSFKTFEMRYKTSTSSVEANFGNPIITVIPL